MWNSAGDSEGMSASMGASRQSSCVICRGPYSTQTHNANTLNLSGPETSAAFKTFCKLLNIVLVQGRTPWCMWDFDVEPLPLCLNCSPVFHKLVQLNEELEQIQLNIQTSVDSVKKQIADSCRTYSASFPADETNKNHSEGDERVESFQKMVLNLPLDSDVPSPVDSEFVQIPECEIKIEVKDETIENENQSDVSAEGHEDQDRREKFRKKRAAYLLRRFNKRAGSSTSVSSEVKRPKKSSSKGKSKAETAVPARTSKRKLKPKKAADYIKHTASSEEEDDGPEPDPDWAAEIEPDDPAPAIKKRGRSRGSVKKSKPAFLSKCTEVDGKYYYKDVEILKNKELGPGYFTCSLCSVTLNCTKGGTSAYDHVDIAHKGNYPFTCEICSKGFNRRYKLEGHKQAEHLGQRELCDICEKPLKNKQSVSAHKKSHRGQEEIEAEAVANRDRPEKKPRKSYQETLNYQCPKCGKIFNSNSKLKMHDDLTHLGIRLKCSAEGCEETFNNPSTLREHIQKIHQEPNRNYECGECHKLFHCASLLKSHLVTHSLGPKPFRCSFCSCEYTRQFSLRTHIMQVHSDPKEYHCHLCGTSYTRFVTFQRHNKKHHPAPPPPPEWSSN